MLVGVGFLTLRERQIEREKRRTNLECCSTTEGIGVNSNILIHTEKETRERHRERNTDANMCVEIKNI